MMAANGYIVVAPNRRGLPGFGQEWLEEISGDYGGQCMKDYLSAIASISAMATIRFSVPFCFIEHDTPSACVSRPLQGPRHLKGWKNPFFLLHCITFLLRGQAFFTYCYEIFTNFFFHLLYGTREICYTGFAACLYKEGFGMDILSVLENKKLIRPNWQQKWHFWNKTEYKI